MNAQQWARVKELFHGALEQAPADREAFLADACGGNGEASELRAEVERLLAADANSGDFIDSGSSGLTGRNIGRYEVGTLVGIGGMGQVYAAKDLELRRAVAIKIGIATDADSHARLKREAQHASQLNHPHICTIHEVGVFEGQPFIVMEFVEGQPLSDVIPRDGLPAEDTVRYATQIADGLAHAHAHGVLHRDLKSQNVIITMERRAKILDFGLARRLSAERLRGLSHSQESVTSGGAIAGTLSCMAPELLRAEPADERSDIWALGVLLYEMATGRRPFTGATGFELCGAILHAPLPPIPDRIPNALQEIIRRCLAKNPAERYQNAEDVRSAFEGVSAANAVGTAHVRKVPLVAVAVLLAVLIGAGVLWRARTADTPGPPVAVGASGNPAVAIMSFDVAGASDSDAAWLSRGVPQMLVTGLAQTRGLDVVSTRRLLETAKQVGAGDLDKLDRSGAAEVARQAGAGAVVVGSVFQSGANIRIDAQLEDLVSGKVLVAETVRGTDVFAIVDQLALQIRSGVGLADAPGIRRIADVSTPSVEAYRLYAQGVDAYDHLRMQDARRLLLEAVRLDPAFASANLHLGLLTYFDGREADRQRYFAEAAKRGNRLSERQRLLLQGYLAYDAGNDAESARILDEIVARYPEFEDAYPSVLGLYAPLKGPRLEAGKHVAILARGVQALPRSGMLRNMYGYALLDAGQFTRALEQFQEYARLLPHEPNAHDSLGEAHLAMLMPEKALEHYARALAIDPSFESDIGRAIALAMLGRFEEWNSDRPGAYSMSAFIASRAGRYRDAAEILRTAMKRAQANAHAIGQASCHLMSSMLALERKQFVRARDEAAVAREVVARLPGLRSRASMTMADLLSGIAYARAGNVKAAHVDLQSLQARLDSNVPMERELIAALEGEIALATGDLDKAATAFSASEPPARRWTQIFSEYPPALGNNPPFMDGAARVAKARGDLNGAIAIYRGLLSMDSKKKWAAVVEPRYSLEIARLLEKVGDKSAAIEYERFLTLWKNADADLPELAEARRAVARFR